jgi:hypothetical protein
MDSATVSILVSKALARGTEHGAGTKWWTISSKAAGNLMRGVFPGKRLPRPGYEVLMPTSTRNGYKGQWSLSNVSGKYELQFYYD